MQGTEKRVSWWEMVVLINTWSETSETREEVEQ